MYNDQYYTSVKVRGLDEPVVIPITSPQKPKIPDSLKKKWQDLLDIVTECIDIPSGLIMQIEKNKISVLLTNGSSQNPYHTDDSDHLLHGLYCETVLGTQKHLLVKNALSDDLWKDNPDVKLGMISYLGYPIMWPDGEFFGTLCVLDNKENCYAQHFIKLISFCKDVIDQDLFNILAKHNELQNAYEQLKNKMDELESSYAVLKGLHNEKIVLLQEVNHRVKNNLQVIIGLIQLQLESIKNEDIHEKMSTIVDKIYSMGIIYNILYKTKNFSRINIKDYLHTVVSNLINSYSKEGQEIALNLYIDDSVFINLETAVPIGLIATEICTNSIKYAFPDQSWSEIAITLKQFSDNSYNMKIVDNGVGIPAAVDFNKQHGSGFEIVEALCMQLNGSIDIERSPHTAFNIRFSPCEKEENRWSKKKY